MKIPRIEYNGPHYINVIQAETKISIKKYPKSAVIRVETLFHGVYQDTDPQTLTDNVIVPMMFANYLSALMQRGDSDETIRKIASGEIVITPLLRMAEDAEKEGK